MSNTDKDSGLLLESCTQRSMNLVLMDKKGQISKYAGLTGKWRENGSKIGLEIVEWDGYTTLGF